MKFKHDSPFLQCLSGTNSVKLCRLYLLYIYTHLSTATMPTLLSLLDSHKQLITEAVKLLQQLKTAVELQ